MPSKLLQGALWADPIILPSQSFKASKGAQFTERTSLEPMLRALWLDLRGGPDISEERYLQVVFAELRARILRDGWVLSIVPLLAVFVDQDITTVYSLARFHWPVVRDLFSHMHTHLQLLGRCWMPPQALEATTRGSLRNSAREYV